MECYAMINHIAIAYLIRASNNEMKTRTWESNLP